MALYHGHGTIIHEYKTLKPCKSMCSGCYDNYYNYQDAIDHTYGAKECWSFKNAKVVDKEAYYSIYDNKTRVFKKTLSCYHGVNN